MPDTQIKDAFIEAIAAIEHHPNADRLDIATVKGYKCVVPRGAYKPGDVVLYVAPDACIDTRRPWWNGYEKYLAKGGRVRIVKLRGFLSEGLIVPLSTFPEGKQFKDFGISHWEPPSSPNSGLLVRSPRLPFGLEKTDQTNVQQLDPATIYLKRYLVTRKLDGCSCTVAVRYKMGDSEPDVHITSRSIDLKPESDNIYTRATGQAVDLLCTLAREYAMKSITGSFTIVVRGEICGDGINANKANIDCKGPPTFYLFESLVMLEDGQFEHFIIPERWNGFLNEVPIIETIDSLRPEHVEKYLNAPASDGEGVVLWEIDHLDRITGFSFKIKSKEYYAKLG